MARPWPAAPDENTLHVLGDLHFGPSQFAGRELTTGALSTARSGKLKEDLLNGKLVPRSVPRIMVGDFVEEAGSGTTPSQDDLDAKAWQSGTDGLGAIPGTFRVVNGNHDCFRDHRTGAQAASVFGYNARNWTLDVGFAKVVGLSPAQQYAPDTFPVVSGDPADPAMSWGQMWLDGPKTTSGTALHWLDTQTATDPGKPIVVIAHAPLKNSVLGAASGIADSTGLNYWLEPNNAIRSILNANSAVKLILSGHTHSSFGNTDWAKLHDVGTRSVVAVNASALFYTFPNSSGSAFYDQPFDPIRSLFVTFTSTQIQLRVRDHGCRCWLSLNGQMVTTFTIPA